MCGICCILIRKNDVDPKQKMEQLHYFVHRRGPELQCMESIKFGGWKGHMELHRLQTQGFEQLRLKSDDGTLLWNGDAYRILSHCDFNDGVSDGENILRHLATLEVPNLLTNIVGEYSFIFWSSRKEKLYFARDPLGRRSLLWRLCDNTVELTSVAKCGSGFEEVPAVGLYEISFGSDYELTLYPWSHFNLAYIEKTFTFPVRLNIQFDKNMEYFEMPLSWNLDTIPFYSQWQWTKEALLSVAYKLLSDDKVLRLVIDFNVLLHDAVKQRVITQVNRCKNCTVECSHTNVGVVFSGGLDSTVVAALVHQTTPLDESIELLNVAFAKDENGDCDHVPDRVTALESVEELKSLFPSRVWKLIKVNVKPSELEHHRKTTIRHLIYPQNTNLDDSLGCALWFACRGEGLLGTKLYKATSRILLTGMGADELLGGYMRSWNMAKREGWEATGAQMRDEILRIGSRNMGRDDRVSSDNAVVVRHPFLDERVVQFLIRLPPHYKFDPIQYNHRGFGDKLLLRLMAVNLGLRKVAFLPKKAFQFGSRIANPKEKGDEECERLQWQEGIS